MRPCVAMTRREILNTEAKHIRHSTEVKHYSSRVDTVTQPGKNRQQQQLNKKTSWKLTVVFTWVHLCMCIGAWTSHWIYRSRGFVLVFFQLQVVAARRKNQTISGERNQAFKTLGAVTLVGELEQERLCEGEEWFLHDLTVCFSARCIKSC